MPIKVTCSNCGGVLHAPDDAGGKKGRCPTCGNVLPIPADSPRISDSGGVAEPAQASPRAKRSFGDLGPGGPTSDASRAASAARASSAEPTSTNEPQRKSGMPAPADYEKVEAKRSRVPAASRGTGIAPPSEALVRAWMATRGGLWWIRSAVFFAMIPVLVMCGLVIYRHFGGPLSFIKDEGFLKVGLKGMDEVWVAGVMLPAALAGFCLMLGRLGFSRVPTRVQARGLALSSALATFAGLTGLFAVIFPSIAAFATEGDVIWHMFDLPGMEATLQRYGLTAAFVGLLLGEAWFASALGRVGTALEDKRSAARATRYQLLVGLLFATMIFTGTWQTGFPFDSTGWPALGKFLSGQTQSIWMLNVQPEWDRLGDLRLVVLNGAALLGVMLFGLSYWRMVGSARRAIRQWLDQPLPT